MSIRLRKQRQLVGALLRRDLARVETFGHLKPNSPVTLEHALTGIEEWCARVQDTLRACFEDQRIAEDVTERLAGTLADLRIPRSRGPRPGLAYKSVFARITGMKARVEQLVQALDLYVEPEDAPPLTQAESALVSAEQLRVLRRAMIAATNSRPSSAESPPRHQLVEPHAGFLSREIFISHSSRDQVLAERLVDLLTAAFEPPLSRGEIMCTSVPGCTLEGGARTDDRLLAEIRGAPVFIGLVTPPAVNSGYVLFELGARWAVGGTLTVPVLGPATTADLLPGPWKGVNAHRTDKRDRVLQLVNEVSRALGRGLQPSHTWDNRVVALAEAQEPRITTGDIVLEGRDLQRLAEDALAYRALLEESVEVLRDSRIVDAAIQLGELDVELLRDHEQVKDQVQKIFTKAQTAHPNLDVRLAKIQRDAEHACDALVFVTTASGAPRETKLDFAYLSGAEWGELAALHAALAEVGPGPYRVETGRGEYEVRDILEAVQVLRTDGAVS